MPGRAPADPVRSRLRASSVLMGWGMEDSLERADAMRSRGWGCRDASYDVCAVSTGAQRRCRAGWACAVWRGHGGSGVDRDDAVFVYPQLSVPAPWPSYVVYAAWMVLPCALHAIDEKRFG